MSDEKRLTLNDPVSKEEREYLQQLDMAKTGFAQKLLALELEKVNLIAASRRIENQTEEVFQKILVNRGQPADLAVNIDIDTGVIKVQNPERQKAPAPPVEKETTPEV